MLSRETLFEYRAWPSEQMPHAEALHHMFGQGVADIRTDTYILSPHRPDWLMIVRGGTHFEIKARTADQDPVSIWTTLMRYPFPLPRNAVLTLQAAFPQSELPRQICEPVDLLSWLEPEASTCTVSQRIVNFSDGDCMAELTQLSTEGRRMETFCLSAKRYDPLIETLKMIPGPRLPNRDFRTWIRQRRQARPATPCLLERPAAPAAPLLAPAGSRGARSLAEWSAQVSSVESIGRKAADRRAGPPKPRVLGPREGDLRLGETANDNTPVAPTSPRASLKDGGAGLTVSSRLRICGSKIDWRPTQTWRCAGESVHIRP